MSGLSFSYVVRRADSRVELVTDRGDAAENRHLLNLLRAKREQIESDFGAALSWVNSEGVRTCRIHKTINAGELRDRDSREEIMDLPIDAIIKLKALRPYLETLRTA